MKSPDHQQYRLRFDSEGELYMEPQVLLYRFLTFALRIHPRFNSFVAVAVHFCFILKSKQNVGPRSRN